MDTGKDDILDDNFIEKKSSENLTKDSLTNSLGILLAKGSFILGSILFFSGIMIPDNFNIIILGYYFTMIAVTINLVYFLFLCFKPGTKAEKRSHWKTAGIMTINIPIALFYFYIIVSSI